MNVVSNGAEGPRQRTTSQIDKWREELDGYYEEMRQFSNWESEEIFMKLAAWSARASEIRSRLVRRDSRADTTFRTQEIDPFLSEIERQFRLFSRVQSTREMDYRLAGKL